MKEITVMSFLVAGSDILKDVDNFCILFLLSAFGSWNVGCTVSLPIGKP